MERSEKVYASGVLVNKLAQLLFSPLAAQYIFIYSYKGFIVTATWDFL